MTSRAPPRKHVCPHCRKSYGKAEHLIVRRWHVFPPVANLWCRDTNDLVRFSEELVVYRLTITDTGSRPFSCEVCARKFTRPDSLARHTKAHARDAGNPGPSRTADCLEDDAPLFASGSGHSIPAWQSAANLALGPSSESFPPSYSPLPDFEHAADINLEDEAFSLNWPDSTDLLNSILSAEFCALPSLETLPSRPIVRKGQRPDEQFDYPGLTSDSAQADSHGGQEAVHNLSNIIKTLVS